MEFSLSLRQIEHGWASLTVAGREHAVTYRVSNVLGDTLSALLDTAFALLAGQDDTISLFLEPEVCPYVLKAQPNALFSLEIQNQMFCGSVKRYVRQVLHLFDSYTQAFDASDYVAQWGHAFPGEKVEHLRVMLRAMK